MNPFTDSPYTAYIGIDWADTKHDVCLQAAGCEQVATHFGLPVSPHILAHVSQPDKFLECLPEDAPADLRQVALDSAEAGVALGMTLGCAVGKANIEGVLDLRRRDAQQWLFERFVPKGPVPTEAKNFVDILPELLQQSLGGSTPQNMRLQVIGATLRRAGLNGLIYPSARTDVGVSYEGDEIARFRGWNMVLFRGGAPREAVHFDMGGWETRFWKGVQCHREVGDDGEIVEWYVAGLEAINHLRYTHKMEQRGILPK